MIWISTFWWNRSGRLPTNWFEQQILEKSLRTPRTRRIKEVFDLSQRTQIEEVTKKHIFSLNKFQNFD